MATYQLVQHQGDFVRRSITVGTTPTSIGRSPTNDLVIQDDTCSWHHVLFWVEGQALWLRDLNSSNGTYHNGSRITGASVRVRPGDRVTLGEYVELSIQSGTIGWVSWKRALTVQDLDSQVSYAVKGDRFVIGSHPHADLKLKAGPAVAGTLIVHGNGEVWYGDPVRLDPLVTDRPFSVAGRTFALGEVDPSNHPVVVYEVDRYPYRLVIARDGMRAKFEDPRSPDRTRAIDGSIAATLVPLASALDVRTFVHPEEKGWLSEREIVPELWDERTGATVADLRTALWCVRAALLQAGMDPWCVEQRERFCRLRVAEVVWTS